MRPGTASVREKNYSAHVGAIETSTMSTLIVISQRLVVRYHHDGDGEPL